MTTSCRVATSWWCFARTASLTRCSRRGCVGGGRSRRGGARTSTSNNMLYVPTTIEPRPVTLTLIRCSPCSSLICLLWPEALREIPFVSCDQTLHHSSHPSWPSQLAHHEQGSNRGPVRVARTCAAGARLHRRRHQEDRHPRQDRRDSSTRHPRKSPRTKLRRQSAGS